LRLIAARSICGEVPALLPDPQHRQDHAPPPHALGDGEKVPGEPQAPGRGEQAGPARGCGHRCHGSRSDFIAVSSATARYISSALVRFRQPLHHECFVPLAKLVFVRQAGGEVGRLLSEQDHATLKQRNFPISPVMHDRTQRQRMRGTGREMIGLRLSGGAHDRIPGSGSPKPMPSGSASSSLRLVVGLASEGNSRQRCELRHEADHVLDYRFYEARVISQSFA
jgi:hypothetical protein